MSWRILFGPTWYAKNEPEPLLLGLTVTVLFYIYLKFPLLLTGMAIEHVCKGWLHFNNTDILVP